MPESTSGFHGWQMGAAARPEPYSSSLDMTHVTSYQRIYAVVRRIPRGKVASYGQVAKLAGLPGRARQVGYAMFALPKGTTVPWQRVINAQGRVSRRRIPGAELTQRVLLEREGVWFSASGRVDLNRSGWKPRTR